MRRTASRTAALIMLATAMLLPSRVVNAQSVVLNEPVVRGEVARLLRQAYDYEHRNSNRNVFRKSRHFHPTQNVFRSSRHYQQRLASSSDGYPRRTFVRFDRSVDGGPREQIEYSFAHHRRSPFGLPSIEEPGLEALVLSDVGRSTNRPYRRYECATPNHSRYDQLPAAPQQIEYRLITPESAAAALDADNTQTSADGARTDIVIRHIKQPDGATRTVISNAAVAVLDGDSIDDAWRMLAGADDESAAKLFKRHVMHEQRGAEAMVGYGLAKLLAGDVEAAESALRRAQILDEQVLVRTLIENDLRIRLQDRLDEETPLTGDVDDALKQLLD